MTNRLTTILHDIDRQAEHQRRLDRVCRSHDMYAAAMAEAMENGLVLACSGGRYTLSDAQLYIAFYPCTQIVMRSIAGRNRLERIDLTAECDVYDIVLNFLAGEFLK